MECHLATSAYKISSGDMTPSKLITIDFHTLHKKVCTNTLNVLPQSYVLSAIKTRSAVTEEEIKQWCWLVWGQETQLCLSLWLPPSHRFESWKRSIPFHSLIHSTQTLKNTFQLRFTDLKAYNFSYRERTWATTEGEPCYHLAFRCQF